MSEEFMKIKLVVFVLIFFIESYSVASDSGETASPFNLNWLSQTFQLAIEDVQSASFEGDYLYKVVFKPGKEEAIKAFDSDLQRRGCEPVTWKGTVNLKTSNKQKLLDAKLSDIDRLVKAIAAITLKYKFKSRGFSKKDALSSDEMIALSFVDLFEQVYPYANNLHEDFEERKKGVLVHVVGNAEYYQLANEIVQVFSRDLETLIFKIDELFSNQEIKAKIAPLCDKEMIFNIGIFLGKIKKGSSVYDSIVNLKIL